MEFASWTTGSNNHAATELVLVVDIVSSILLSGGITADYECRRIKSIYKNALLLQMVAALKAICLR